MNLPIVAIVGRPNVGKSTLFNRIIRKPLAITDDRPGVTRDRNAIEFEWNGKPFMLVDTGGFVTTNPDTMEQAVSEQCRLAIGEADVVILLVDVKTGITDFDERIRDEVVRSHKPVIPVVNKIDGNRDEYGLFEFYNLGLGDPLPVSGKTGRGTGDLLDEVFAILPDGAVVEDDGNHPLRIAFVGRPNMGKSSLVNSLAGEERVLVTDIPGTTRDSIDTHIVFNDRPITIVDTAGLKKITRLKESLEYYSFLRTQKSIGRCDVVVVVIDIDQGLTTYEKNVVNEVSSLGKGLLIAANKWDLVEKDHMTMKKIEQEIYDELPDKTPYPVVFTSALTGQRVTKLLETAVSIDDARKYRVKTADFNDFIKRLTVPPGAGDFSILYGTQYAVEPPSFIIFVNDVRRVKDNFTRFLERRLRERFGFIGTPIRISYKKRKSATR